MNTLDHFSPSELAGLFILFTMVGTPILTGCLVILITVIRGDGDTWENQ